MEESIPNEIIEILTESGFDNILAMAEIDQADIAGIESFSGKSILPGHKKFIVALGRQAKLYESSREKTKTKCEFDQSVLTFIMKELNKTAMQNANVAPTRYRYSEAIQWFSTYIFLLSGRAAYEFLCSNLPLPKVSTIRKYL